jgi:hypothetical protein
MEFRMNSIVYTHVFTPDGAKSHYVALDRLGDWCTAELGSLARLLRLMGYTDAAADIALLHGLHLDPSSGAGDIARLLEDAAAALERLLERVRAFPVAGETVGPAPSDFEAWVCWSGARLEDIHRTVRRALAT